MFIILLGMVNWCRCVDVRWTRVASIETCMDESVGCLQEVTLRRENADDRLGLTLFYRDVDDDDSGGGTGTPRSDVIVGQVSPHRDTASHWPVAITDHQCH